MDAQGDNSRIDVAGRVRDLATALLVGCAFFAIAHLSLALPRDEGRLAPIWLPNALALSVLLRTPSRRWPTLVAACLLGNVLASRWTSGDPFPAICLSLSNGVEYTLGALLLRRLLGDRIALDGGRQLVALAAVAAGVAMAAATLSATALHLLEGANFLKTLQTWGLAHPLGLLLLTPCLMVLSRSREHLRERPFTRRAALAMAGLLACALGVFLQRQAPVLFMVPPVLLVVAIEFGALGAAVGVLLTAMIAVACTLNHLGPVALTHGDATYRAVVLQAFLVICAFSSLPVANMQARQRRLQADTLAQATRAATAEAAALQSEARYRRLADTVSDAIVTLGLGGEMTFVSPAAWALTGFADRELTGRRIRDFIHADDYAAMRRAYAELATGRRTPGAPLECRFRRADGEWIWLQLNPQVVLDTDRRPVGFVDVARDISDRRAIEAALRLAREEAESAANAKAEFLANMSHELRTPLTSIVGFADIAAGQPQMPDLVRNCIDRVRNAGQALLCTVNDILDFSKLEAGQVQIKPAPCDIAQLCATTLELFTPQAAAKDVCLDSEGCDAPLPVVVDASRVRQILLNLVGNAVKFTEAGQVSVAVRHEADWLAIEVSDTGAGIAADKLHLLFQRFSQVDGSLARAHSGTGLGLAICKGLVEAMGGEIGATSEIGRGSRFWFRIPAPAAEALDAAGGDSMAAAAELDGLRVLVVDDHATNRELVKLFLHGFGVEISEAADGDEAVEAASNWPYDLILMDLRMPRLDGVSAMRQIRSGGGPNDMTPILAYTADATAEDFKRLTACGFDAVVAKPVQPATLIAAIGEALNGGCEDRTGGGRTGENSTGEPELEAALAG